MGVVVCGSNGAILWKRSITWQWESVTGYHVSSCKTLPRLQWKMVEAGVWGHRPPENREGVRMSEFTPQDSKLSRSVSGWWWSAALGVFMVALFTMVTGPGSRGAGAVDGSCPGPFTIDFAGLAAGTILGEQYAAQGVHISGVANGGFPDALIVFDTNAPPTHDPDLAVGIGNIAVLAKDLTDSNGDGLVDDPDENNF